MEHILAYDLETGGVKASIFDENGRSVAETMIEHPTYYSLQSFHEQDPSDWWSAIQKATALLTQSNHNKKICALFLVPV